MQNPVAGSLYQFESGEIMFRYCMVVIVVSFFTSGFVAADSKIDSGDEFPWELVIDRGKINGCIYDNKYYSNGSIIVKETLPRKCKIDPNRDGFWAQLDEDELKLYEASVRSQMKLEEEAVTVGGQPLDRYEAAIVRFMRKSKE